MNKKLAYHKKLAYQMGLDTGHEIAECNFKEFINDGYKEELEESYHEKDDHGFQCIVTNIENEHYRQFSPFELVAKEFNENQDSDEVWEEYERGVWDAAKQTFDKLKKENK